MRVKASEKEHIDAVGDRWPRVIAAVTIAVRSSPKFTGLDKVREPLALQAALKATGYGNPGLILPRTAGDNRFCQDVADEVFAEAVKAGERAFIAETA